MDNEYNDYKYAGWSSRPLLAEVSGKQSCDSISRGDKETHEEYYKGRELVN